MIRIQKSFKKEYLEHSLCSFDLSMHGPLARPYETVMTVGEPGYIWPLVLCEAGGLFLCHGGQKMEHSQKDSDCSFYRKESGNLMKQAA